MKAVAQRLRDILGAIEAIERHATSERHFRDEELVQVWTIHHIQIIGEACSSIDRAWREAHDHVQWGAIIGMRQVLVHRYWRVDIDVVWSTVERDLPTLRAQLEALLDEMHEGE